MGMAFFIYNFKSIQNDFPDPPRDVRPSGRENQPGQKFGISRPGRPKNECKSKK
jgi:hypothetical protein